MSIATAAFCGTVSVGTTSQLLRPVNLGRQEITVTNDGSNVVYLQLQTASGVDPTAATTNAGIRLAAGGGSWDSRGYRGSIAAVALTGATNVNVVEI